MPAVPQILNCPKPHSRGFVCIPHPPCYYYPHRYVYPPMLLLSSQIHPPGHAIIILTDTCCPLVISYPHRYDASLIEINPLAELTDGRVLCLDCKINFDDNAEYRHKELFQKRDLTQV